MNHESKHHTSSNVFISAKRSASLCVSFSCRRDFLIKQAKEQTFVKS